jgi:hypothetical protein
MVFITLLLEVGILKVMSDLSNNTKYRTTDRAFQDHNTLPTPLHLALHLVFHLSSTMLPHHRHLMVFIMPQLEVEILKVMSDLSNNTQYPTATTTTKERTESIKTTTPYQPPPPGLYNAPPLPTPALYDAPPPPNGLYNAPIGS